MSEWLQVALLAIIVIIELWRIIGGKRKIERLSYKIKELFQ